MSALALAVAVAVAVAVAWRWPSPPPSPLPAWRPPPRRIPAAGVWLVAEVLRAEDRPGARLFVRAVHCTRGEVMPTSAIAVAGPVSRLPDAGVRA